MSGCFISPTVAIHVIAFSLCVSLYQTATETKWKKKKKLFFYFCGTNMLRKQWHYLLMHQSCVSVLGELRQKSLFW